MMKKILLLFLFLLSVNSWAAPVLNENKAIDSMVTFYPDSIDADLYYFMPQYMGVCRDSQGHPIFSYTEFKTKGFFSRDRGLMNATLCMKVDEAQMKKAFQNVLAANPKAHFVGLPFMKSSLEISNGSAFIGVLEQASCNNIAGQVGQQEACSLLFSPNGKEMFKKALRSGDGFNMHFNYTLSGVTRTETGALQSFEGNFSIAADISKSDFNGELDKYLPRDELGAGLDW